MTLLKPTFLVTGGTGLSLISALLLSGYHALAAVRSVNSFVDSNVDKIIIRNISATTDWTDLLKSVGMAIHCAGRAHIVNESGPGALTEFRKVNLDATLTLACQAAEVGVKRFVFISSIKVNGEMTLSHKVSFIITLLYAKLYI